MRVRLLFLLFCVSPFCASFRHQKALKKCPKRLKRHKKTTQTTHDRYIYTSLSHLCLDSKSVFFYRERARAKSDALLVVFVLVVFSASTLALVEKDDGTLFFPAQIQFRQNDDGILREYSNPLCASSNRADPKRARRKEPQNDSLAQEEDAGKGTRKRRPKKVLGFWPRKQRTPERRERKRKGAFEKRFINTNGKRSGCKMRSRRSRRRGNCWKR